MPSSVMRYAHDNAGKAENSSAQILFASGRALKFSRANEDALQENGAGRHAGASLHLAKGSKLLGRRGGPLGLLGNSVKAFT